MIDWLKHFSLAILICLITIFLIAGQIAILNLIQDAFHFTALEMVFGLLAFWMLIVSGIFATIMSKKKKEN